ncbi:hypothetical protein RI129_011039 [Pyrocoelia pectoralis]|uniref:Uncharacterized protein n=1 Tax=Pyrocoelia pectoralis TaxID=417401 RepID=A0AAN7V4M5_9COLE
MSSISISFLVSTFLFTTVMSYLTTKEATAEYLESSRRRLAEATERCIRSTGADPVEIDLLFDKAIHSESRSLKCYLECIYLDQNYIDSNGKFIHENVIHGTANATMDLIEECADKADSITDGCEKVSNFSHCVMHTNNTAILKLL